MFYLTLEKIFKIYVGLGTQDYYTAYIRLKMKKKNIAIIKIDYLKYFLPQTTLYYQITISFGFQPTV